MITHETIKRRYDDLENKMKRIDIDGNPGAVNRMEWQEWANAVLNLFNICFGENSNYYQNFNKIYQNFRYSVDSLDSAIGIFISAKVDYINGFYNSLEKKISGEIFGDFVVLAKTSLHEGNKDVAAVLACAALEDALKKYAILNKLDVSEKTMTDVVNLLKSSGLVKGAQKTLLDVMPKIRNYAMHANWEKINKEDVSSIIGFVEQFLLSNF